MRQHAFNKAKAPDDALIRALRPFVAAYLKKAEAFTDADLDNEQPRSISVTLGDCRRAAAVLRSISPGF